MARQSFFERQTLARRNTAVLVLLFLSAVLLITLAVDLVGYLLTRQLTPIPHFGAWLLSEQGLLTSGAVVGVIATGSMVRWVDLSGGGDRVARMVGARLLDPSGQDSDEQRLRNIVEEMSIASGVPVPDLYIMDNEPGINAFVAGQVPSEAVMVVTHGALTHLSRDELQGVVGHEFSHILNGDMGINVRLIALLAGILMIGQIGQFLLTGSTYRSSYSRSRHSNRGIHLAAGLALMAIGYIGLFFGRLIQSAISRQRESLADASSVQFTRNPEALGRALHRIGQHSGYFQASHHGSDVNHMCFTETVRMRLAGWLASHPPLEERIRAIDPALPARLRNRERDQLKPETAAEIDSPEAGGGFFAAVTAPVQGGSAAFISQTRLSDSAGAVSPANGRYAKDLLRRLPDNVRTLARTRTGAVQLCHALAVQGEKPPDTPRPALDDLTPDAPSLKPDPDQVHAFLSVLDALGPAIRFPLLEMAMPALRRLDPEERAALTQQLHTLIRDDGRVSLFELALVSFIQRHLTEAGQREAPVRFRRYAAVQDRLAVLLSLIARAATPTMDEARACYTEAMAGFGTGKDLPPLQERVTLKQLMAALKALRGLSPLLKPPVLDACQHCVLRDDRVEQREYELIRLVADQLDCPMPPLPVRIDEG
ncbi:Zn-dependent protease with chaperone function [Tamilnaduibacter salinus]|uniref:Zn-dependent protease with chaperone function n=1 Tax=Tamilnaduibacter salinus TaxID=1484056 RepID=A0A2U1D1G9_9GAMM|nr:M48 family metallopeptidase [Tamilnaduibacter salinus]PVY79217.1 Zn-dependent protease with chaperone function [Tamilnaduibacter salinus]